MLKRPSLLHFIIREKMLSLNFTTLSVHDCYVVKRGYYHLLIKYLINFYRNLYLIKFTNLSNTLINLTVTMINYWDRYTIEKYIESP